MKKDSVTIRKAKENDLETLQKLSEKLTLSDSKYDPALLKNWAYTKYGQKYLKSRIFGKKCVCFLAVVKGEITGYATGSVIKTLTWRKIKRVQLENLLVRDNMRNKGIGVKLIDAFCDWGKEMKAERILVEAYYNNNGAVKFYKRNNFVEDTLLFERTLL